MLAVPAVVLGERLGNAQTGTGRARDQKRRDDPQASAHECTSWLLGTTRTTRNMPISMWKSM